MKKIMKYSFFKELNLRKMLFLALVFGFLINNSEVGCCCGCKSNGKTSKKGKHGGGKPSGEPKKKGGDKKDDEVDDKKNTGGEGNKEDENKENKEGKPDKKITLKFTINNDVAEKVKINENSEIDNPVQESGKNGGAIWLFRVDNEELGIKLFDPNVKIVVENKEDELSETYLISCVQMAEKYEGGGRYYILYSSNCESTSFGGLFDCSGLENNAFQCNITVMKLFACGSNVKSMRFMFYKCSSLKELKFGNNFNTSEIVDMSDMFCGCSSLEKVKFGNNFNTSKVTNIFNMFCECSSLKELDVSNFNTSKVTNMCNMFCGCKILNDIKFGNNFNTNNVENMGEIFHKCNEKLRKKMMNDEKFAAYFCIK